MATPPDFTTETGAIIRGTARVGYNLATLSQAQTFTATLPQISQVAVALARYGEPLPALALTLAAELDPETPLAHMTLTPAGLSTDYRQPTWVDVPLPAPVPLVSGHGYRLTLTTESPTPRAFYYWIVDNGDPYAGGKLLSGSTGRTDAFFRAWINPQGAPPPTPLPFDFALLEPAPLVVTRPAVGQIQVPLTLEVRLLAGEPRPVVLTMGTLPVGFTLPPLAPQTPPAVVTVPLWVAATAATGLQTWTLGGTSGDVQHAATIRVDVRATPPVEPPPSGGGPTTTGDLRWVRTVPVGHARDVKRKDDLLIVGTNTGVTLLDLTHPEAPVVLGSLATGMRVNGLTWEGEHVYAVGEGRFAIVDISTPTEPRLVFAVASTSATGYGGGLFRVGTSGVTLFLDVAVKAGIAFVASLYGTVHVLDCTTPAAPTRVRCMGVVAIPAGQPASPTNFANFEALSEYRGNGACPGLSIAGDTLAVTEWKYGHLHTYDVSNPRVPVYRGGHAASYQQDVIVQGDWLFALGTYGNQSGLWTAKLPPMPPAPYAERATTMASLGEDGATFLRTLAVSMDQGGLAVTRSGAMLVYAGGNTGTLEVLDISNPVAPVSVAQGRLTTGASYGIAMMYTVGVALWEDYIYVGAGSAGLQVYRFPGLDDFTPKPLLRVLPTTGFATSGKPGGPFAPLTKAYALRNVGQLPLDWTATVDAPWASATPDSGTLAVGQEVAVTVSVVSASADDLGEGVHVGGVSLTNTSGAGFGSTTRAVTLTAREYTLMQVLPSVASGIFQSMGPVGGPFAPTAMTWTVKNLGNVPMDWSATIKAGSPWWGAPPPVQDSLEPGETTAVTLTLDQAVAIDAPAGGYADVLEFRNLTDDTFRAIDGTNETGPTGRTLQLLAQDFGASLYEGFGAVTRGGEGKPVYRVTTLAATGPGSLADALSQGNRYIVFDVGGVITPADYLWCKDNVTVDGLSAPAPGITIKGKGLLLRGTRGCHDAIVTGISTRETDIDGLAIDGGVFNIVVAFCSMHGAMDGNLDIGQTGVRNVTVCWSLIHGPRGEGKNSLMAYHPQGISLHHNLYRGPTRNPQGRYDDEGGSSPGTTFDFRNNLIATTGVGTWMRWGVAANLVNNYYLVRTADIANTITLDGGGARYYVAGNGSSLPSYDPNLQSNWGRRPGTVEALSAPLPAPPITMTDARTAADQILESAGPKYRDAVDQAVIAEVRALMPLA